MAGWATTGSTTARFARLSLDYFPEQTTARGKGESIPREAYDDYTNFLRSGSAGDFARAGGLDQLPFWRKIEEHPAYDAFWQGQALDKIMAKLPLTVPTMWLQGLWDQEDMWGAIHCYEAVEPKDASNDKNYLVMGPWRHSQVNYEGFSLGPPALGRGYLAAVPPRCAASILQPVSA